MMNKFFLVVLATASLFLFGCEKKEAGTFDLNFTGFYGNNPMVIGEKYDYPGDAKLFFEKARFFISDIELIAENGSAVSLKDVELVNFSPINLDETAARAGQTFSYKDLPTGNYKGLNFKIGLSDDLNDRKPADFPNGHPLADSEPYWADWNSYIFTTISGRANFDTDNIYETGFVYHLGGDGVVKNKMVLKDFTITDSETASLKLKLDLEKVFVNDSGTFDIKTINQVHTQLDLMKAMSQRFYDALFVVE